MKLWLIRCRKNSWPQMNLSATADNPLAARQKGSFIGIFSYRFSWMFEWFSASRAFAPMLPNIPSIKRTCRFETADASEEWEFLHHGQSQI